MKIAFVVNFVVVLAVVLGCRRKRPETVTKPLTANLELDNLGGNNDEQQTNDVQQNYGVTDGIPFPAADTTYEEEESQEKKRRILLIGIRGECFFDTEILRKDAFFGELLKKAADLPYVYSPFPSKPISGLYGVATGLLPEHNGVVANNFRDSKGTLFSVDKPVPGTYLGEPIWTTLHNLDPSKKSVACMNWPGCEFGGFDKEYFVKSDTENPMDWDKKIDCVRKWFSQSSMKLVMMDYSDLYEASLVKGPDSRDRLLREFAHQIEDLVEKLKGVGQYNLIIVGSSSVEPIINADPLLPPLDQLPEEKFKVLASDETMWMVKPNAKDPAAAIKYFKKTEFRTDRYDIFTKEGKDGTRYMSELYPRYKDSDRIPDMMIVARPGFTLTGTSNYGSDGYKTEDHMSTPLFGHGPAFKHLRLFEPLSHGKPIRTVDVHLILCKILGVDPPLKTDSSDYHFHEFLNDWVFKK